MSGEPTPGAGLPPRRAGVACEVPSGRASIVWSVRGVRKCSRTGCGRAAVATLTYVYSDSTAVVGPLATSAEPHSYDLCEQHALRLTAPRGLGGGPLRGRVPLGALRRRPHGARRGRPRGGPGRAAERGRRRARHGRRDRAPRAPARPARPLRRLSARTGPGTGHRIGWPPDRTLSDPADTLGPVSSSIAGETADAARSRVVSQVIKAYDVRGLVGEQLDAAFVRDVGAAFATLLTDEAGGAPANGIVIGRDMRDSSPELAAAFAEGVTSLGVDVVDIGLASTDMLYYASGALDAPGAMFTASHNPAAYNGIKLCRAGASPVGQDTGLDEIAALLDRGPGEATAGHERRPGARSPSGTCARTTRPTSTAWSTCRASGGSRSSSTPATAWPGTRCPRCSSRCPLEVYPLYFELDGTFPNHEANPLDPDNLVDLQREVSALERVDVGLAFDGDADRVFLVDEKGDAVSPSAITALVATRELAKEPGATIIHNLITSRGRARDRRRARREARSAPAWATRSSRRRWPRPGRSSAASTPRTTTSATSSGPTPGCSPRCTCSPRSAEQDRPLSELMARVLPLRGVRRGELDGDDPAARMAEVEQALGDRRRRHHRRPRRPDGVLRRAATGSTCVPRTPSRCCGSTWRPPTPTPSPPCATRSSRWCGDERRRAARPRPRAAGDPRLPGARPRDCAPAPPPTPTRRR